MDGVAEILRAQGLAGAFIMVLLAAIGVLWRSNMSKDRNLFKLQEQRATEREQFVRLVEAGTSALRLSAEVTEKRNAIMGDLADSQNALAHAVDRHNDRVDVQADMFKDKLSDLKIVVGAAGEATRVLTGMVTDVRNKLSPSGHR